MGMYSSFVSWYLGKLPSRMTEREDKGLRRAVHAVERFGRDANHRSDIDDRAGATRNE